jgi:hypothetical protein
VLVADIGAGVGIATGLQAGACLTVEAAKDQGLMIPCYSRPVCLS